MFWSKIEWITFYYIYMRTIRTYVILSLDSHHNIDVRYKNLNNNFLCCV